MTGVQTCALPIWCFGATRFFLNAGSRLADRCFSTGLSRYGWALAFSPRAQQPKVEPGCWSVCVSCGSALDETPVERVAVLLYRCPHCDYLNFYFG